MFVVRCQDKPDHQHVRLDNRSDHLAFLNAHLETLVLAGPLLSDDRQTMIGSLLVFNIADRAALDAVLAADPYAKAGLFESVTVTPFKKVLP
ncbi:YciI family protein [Magnetospirillum molischianum]|uniref:YCII-related domain-containing protein n=1 Tax=Magnetospirillum molischianum DSM 120 TaxID=1150626 RepID=H8FNQ3_MAGML|nr:YciI family protein [Magnetospirillum molischianum]CCG39991.1 conserved hypothetical protein [Magnetospirillum molischianum DSM 120]